MTQVYCVSCWRNVSWYVTPYPLPRPFARIHIVDAEGDEPSDAEIELYEPMERSAFDMECGTFLSEAYAPVDGELRIFWDAKLDEP